MNVNREFRWLLKSNVLLSVNNYYYRRGGAEVVYLAHNQLLQRRDWDVVPFSMEHPKNLDTPWEPLFVREIEFGGSYSWYSKLSMATKVVYSWEAARKIRGLVRRIEPDVCHVHNIYHHISPSILGAVHSEGTPVVMTLHDLKIACPAYKMLTHDGICERCISGNLINVVKHRCIKNSLALSSLVYVESKLHRLLKTYSKNVDKFIVPSEFYRRKLVEWGFDADQMVLVPNFLEAADYAVRKEVGDYFVYVGRLAGEKGLSTLVKAAKHAGVIVKIVGSGPEESTLRKLADRLGAQVDFTGQLSGAKLHEAIAGARAMVLPSEWYENAPISVLEAYASGVPVIGANIGGIPEMIEVGRTGIVFESGSVDHLASALELLNECSDKELLEMGAAARQLVEQRYSTARYLDSMLKVYRDLGAVC